MKGFGEWYWRGKGVRRRCERRGEERRSESEIGGAERTILAPAVVCFSVSFVGPARGVSG
jgi:hypothetical protein